MPLTPAEIATLAGETVRTMDELADALQALGKDLDEETIAVWRALRDSIQPASSGGRRVTRSEWCEIRVRVVALADALAKIDWASTRDARLAVGELAVHILRDWVD